MNKRITLDLIAADGTSRTFTYAEIATHYANCQVDRRREWLESLDPEVRQKYIAQSDSSTLEEDLLKCYDYDYHLMLADRDGCFTWATGKMGFHLSEEDQDDYDVWLHDKQHKLPGDDWHGYRALKAKREEENNVYQQEMRKIWRRKR